MGQSIMEQEQMKLEEVLIKYRQGINDARLMMDGLPGIYRAQPDLLADMMMQTNNRIVHMERGLCKPYFARIDFTAKESGATEQCYIGKIGVVDENQQTVTVDWRAPIASLYYDSNVGSVTYEAPMGSISGELQLKRQIEIENGILRSVNDVDTVSNDDLLKPYLSVNADNRLKNIVASIQGEQNRIIRESIYKNLIVQGVAGSGKTTVALHRIAYLVYNHRDTIQSGQYMVIGPNQFFINYISSILPDLDVNSVPQHTFESLASKYINEVYTLTDSAEKLTAVVNGKHQSRVDRFKTSMEYQAAIELFMKRFQLSAVPDQQFEIKGFPVLSTNMIKSIYEKVDFNLHDNLESMVNQCILYLSSFVETHEGQLRTRLTAYFQQKMQEGVDHATLEQLKKDRAFIVKELENGCRKSLKKYFAITETKILKLYGMFIESCEQYLPESFSETQELKRSTLAGLRKKRVDFEDLPALMYLRYQMKGAQDYESFCHAVIDEAQDFGEFHFFVLRKMMEHCTFTIVGDLAQSIYNYRSIESWDSIASQVFDAKAILCELLKSYRTTVEIMMMANRVSAHLGLGNALPVIRHGEDVGFHPCTPETQIEQIHRLILEQQKNGCQTIAVISKTMGQSDEIYRALHALGLELEHVSSDSERYLGGICTITGYLSKGLEFDGVILCDASEAVYASDRRVDMHLLYVSMTRPLHRLDIVYSGELTKTLQS
ncbi:UvrD-helicase domain-containing protein [Oscillospiraceae bacterium PP1C4]